MPVVCVAGIPAARMLSAATLWFLCNLHLQFADEKRYGQGAGGIKRQLNAAEIVYDVLLPHLADAPLDAALRAPCARARQGAWTTVEPDEGEDPLAVLRHLARYRLEV